MSERLIDLGLHIERQIELAQYNLERGTFDQTILKRQAEEAATALEGLEGQIQTLPEVTRDPLLLKLESVKAQAENLALAAKLGSAPPRRTPADARVRNLDRDGQARSTPANDDCDTAFVVDFGTFAGDTTDATNDGEATCGASVNSSDVWYRYIPPTSGTVVFETIGSSFDTVLSVHEGCPGTMNNQIECNDDATGLQSAVSFMANIGSEYLIRVSGANGATGPYVVTLSEGGSIEGTVTMADTGLPVRSQVKAFNETGFQVGFDYSSDDTGVYRFDSLAPGQYFVATAGAPYLLNELYDDLPCPSGAPNGCDVTAGDAVSVVIGGVTDGIDFVLGNGSVITGTVRSEQTGAPIPNADIELYDEYGHSQSSAETDSSGAYSFGNLPEGNYFVVATSSSYLDELYNDIPCPGGPPDGCSFASGTLVDAVPNTTTSGIDFDLITLGSIMGTITDRATGLPIDSANVKVYDSHGHALFGYAFPDATGTYEFGGLEDGTYYLTAYSSDYALQLFNGIDCPAEGCQILTGTPVVISNQATVIGIDFDLTKKGIITGQVVDSTTATPIQGIRVRVFNNSGSLLGYTYTDPAGNFESDRLNAGTYFVATDDSEYIDEVYDNIPCPDSCDPTNGTPVQVLNEQTTASIDFSIILAGKLTGNVTAEDGSGGVTMEVGLYDSFGTYLGYDTSHDGVYEFVGLDDGQYFVVADRYSSYRPYLEELYDDIDCWGGPPDGCVVTEGTPVTITATTVTSGIDFSLKSGGRVSGLVLDAMDGTHLSGTVYVRELSASDTRYAVLDNGAYSVGGLLPGNYLVIADADNHVDEVWQNLPCAGEYPEFCGLSGATPVTVVPASEITIDFSLQPLAMISGTVRAAEDGSPLGGMAVKAFDVEGDLVATEFTDTSGEYEFNGFWPTTLFIATDTFYEEDFADQLFNNIECPQGPVNGCDPTTGTPLVVDVNTSLHDIDFNLRRTGMISGHISEGASGLPLNRVDVGVWDTDGDFRMTDSTDYQGYYEFHGLEAGIFFVATHEFYASEPTLDMLYDGYPCPEGPPDGCDPTKGTPVPVFSGFTTRFIDLVLPSSSEGITGMVTDSNSGEPIPGIFIDLWDANSGDYELGVLTSRTGTFIANINAGTYVAATDNTGDWVNIIFEEIECPEGSPYNGDCDPMTGTIITVEDEELTTEIDFVLRRADGFLFADGFESGDTALWNITVTEGEK